MSLADTKGVFILERDTHKNSIASWQYPELDAELENVILARWTAVLDGTAAVPPVIVSRFKSSWCYIATRRFGPDDALSGAGDKFPHVAAIAAVVAADSFAPEKWGDFSTLLLTLFSEAGHPLSLMSCYLGVFCRGRWEEGGRQFSVDAFSSAAAAAATRGARELVRSLGEESVLLWCAVLLKKRIAICSVDPAQLLAVVRFLPLLAAHRQQQGNWAASVIWPLVTPSLPEELDDLRSSGVYIAGITDLQIAADHEDLFDVVVDLGAGSVTVAAHATEDFTLGKLHKDVATFMVQAADDAAATDESLVEGVALRTRSILDRLDSLKVSVPGSQERFVTMDSIHAAQVGHPLDRFLFAVAQAEDMTKHAEAGPETATEPVPEFVPQ